MTKSNEKLNDANRELQEARDKVDALIREERKEHFSHIGENIPPGLIIDDD